MGVARREFHTPTNQGKDANESAANDASRAIVTETHSVLRARDTRQEIPPEYVINKLPAPPNRGDQSRTAQRVDHYRVRPLDLGAFETSTFLHGASSEAPNKEAVFGSWEEWGPSWCNAHARLIDFNASHSLGSLVGTQTHDGPIDTADSGHQAIHATTAKK